MRRSTALLLLFFGGAARLLAEQITFSYAPPIGAAYLSREITTRAQQVGLRREELVIAAEANLQLSREAGRIFLLNRIERAAAAKDGKPLDHPLVGAMTGVDVVYVTTSDGVLERVNGLRKIFDRLLPRLQPSERTALERRLARGELDERDRAAWFERVEVLAGQTLALDRDYWFEDAWPVEGAGWIHFQTLLRLGPWETSEGARRLRVRLAYVADARATVAGADRLVPRVKSKFSPALTAPAATGYTLTGSASRLVDPATLEIWRDQTARQIRHQERVSEALALTLLDEEKTDVTLLPAAVAATPKPAKKGGRP